VKGGSSCSTASTDASRAGAPVNFVAVDYATIGDTLSAVDALNAERYG